jgi:hypothetical protein
VLAIGGVDLCAAVICRCDGNVYVELLALGYKGGANIIEVDSFLLRESSLAWVNSVLGVGVYIFVLLGLLWIVLFRISCARLFGFFYWGKF